MWYIYQTRLTEWQLCHNEHTLIQYIENYIDTIISANTFSRTFFFCLTIKWLNHINKLRFNAEVLDYVAMNGITWTLFWNINKYVQIINYWKIKMSCNIQFKI